MPLLLGGDAQFVGSKQFVTHGALYPGSCLMEKLSADVNKGQNHLNPVKCAGVSLLGRPSKGSCMWTLSH